MRRCTFSAFRRRTHAKLLCWSTTIAKNTAQDLVVPVADRNLKLTLRPRMTGMLVGDSKTGIQAVESSADVLENDELLIGSNLHFMAISFALDSLRSTQRMLILPMGEGSMQVPRAGRWRRPVVLCGQVTAGRWKQDEQFSPPVTNGVLALSINAGRSLSMFILCESGTEAEAIQQIETWVNCPVGTGLTEREFAGSSHETHHIFPKARSRSNFLHECGGGVGLRSAAYSFALSQLRLPVRVTPKADLQSVWIQVPNFCWMF